MKYFKIRDAAAHLGGISLATLYRAIESRELRAVRFGQRRRHLLTSDVWLDEWLGAARGEGRNDSGCLRLGEK